MKIGNVNRVKSHILAKKKKISEQNRQRIWLMENEMLDVFSNRVY